MELRQYFVTPETPKESKVYTITSNSGDEYKLQFTTDRSGVIADALLDFLDNENIEVVEIGLARVKGQNPLDLRSLSKKELLDAYGINDGLW